MNRIAWIVFVLLLAPVGLRAEDGSQDSDPEPVSTDPSQIQRFSPEELNTLLSPIALYPDALLAQIFPAATFKDQLADAYRYVQTSPTPNTPPADTVWDASVIALLNYPTVLKKLTDDPMWTDQLGVAAAYQMDDVSAVIQQIRTEAQAAGNLASNAQQTVTTDDGNIEIAPANTDVCYVPEYDPIYVCSRHVDFAWGNPYPWGIWLSNSWDWRHHYINLNCGWRNGGWYRSPRPIFWRPRSRPIPSWYLRGSARRPGPPVRPVPRPFLSRPFVKPALRANPVEHPHAVRPAIQARPTIEKRPLVSRPAFRNEAEGSENNRIQTLKESHRGQVSRPAVQPRPAPERRPAPVQRSAPVHEIINHPTDRGSATREAARGASSRKR